MRKDIITMGDKELTLDNAQAKAKKVFDLLDVRETTRADYKARIGLFLDFTRKHGINRNSFLDFKRELTDRTDLSVSTKNKYLTTARVFLKELNRQGVLPTDITQNIKTFRQSKKHKKDGLTDEEINALMEKIRPLPNTPQTTRLKAILVLLTLQGLRQIELIRLEVSDLDFVSRTAFILGKGQDDKELINLHPETCKNLQEYLKTNKIADGALFTSQSNNSRNRRLTTRAIRGIVKATLAELGINKTTHGFRHYFTTKLIKTYKGDLLEVAQYTRHKSLEMLQVYNDSIKREADLPRFYKAFKGVNF
ncbi:Tyrosine recombinase XerC [subsurface metagenome]